MLTLSNEQVVELVKQLPVEKQVDNPSCYL